MPRAINGERLWAQFCRDYEKIFGDKIDPTIKFKCFEENKEAEANKFWRLWNLGWDSGAIETGSAFPYPD